MPDRPVPSSVPPATRTSSRTTKIVLSVLGLALYGAVELVERFTIPWHVSHRQPTLQAPASSAL